MGVADPVEPSCIPPAGRAYRKVSAADIRGITLAGKLGEKGVFQGSLFYTGRSGRRRSACFRHAVAEAVFTLQLHKKHGKVCK